MTEVTEPIQFDNLTQDIGSKCADDVRAAIHRNMKLIGTQPGALAVSLYAAVTAFGATTGALHAWMNIEADGQSPEVVDQVWAELIRPMLLGELTP